MTPKPRVQRAAYAEDRPRAALLSCLALLALGAGVAAGVQLGSRAPAPPRAPTAPVATRVVDDVKPAAVSADGGALDTPRTEASATRAAAAPPFDAGKPTEVPEPAPAPAPVSPSPPSPAPALAPRLSTSASTLVPGRVAYLRCDGLSTQRGPFPCPRDRAFERAVWRELRALERCALLTPGSVELRVEIASAHAPSLDLRAQDRERTRAARACLGPALGSVRTVLTPERMVVSFAFELRSAAR